jgi:hypothetical protein
VLKGDVYAGFGPTLAAEYLAGQARCSCEPQTVRRG